MRDIRVAIPVAYDYKYLPIALARVYEHADSIILAIDKNRCSWSGDKFAFDESFFDIIHASDPENKIEIYQDNFYDPDLTPMQNDMRERRMMWERHGSSVDSWCIQIDSDEYFVDFGGFVEYLHRLEPLCKGPVSVICPILPLFKKTGDGFLIVDNKNPEKVHVTSTDGFRFNPGKKDLMILAPYPILHQTWARDEDEIRQKIRSWGHSNEVDPDSFFRFWKNLDSRSAANVRNFHPLKGPIWEALKYVKGDIETVLNSLSSSKRPMPTHRDLIKGFYRKVKFDVAKSRIIRDIYYKAKNVLGKH